MSPGGASKFYLRAPDLEYDLQGPIQIGNVIRDLKRPQDPIATLDPIPPIITGSGFKDGTLEHEEHIAFKLSFSSKLYEIFGGQTEARTGSSLRTTYEFDEIEAQYLQKNPTKADAEKLRDTNKEVKGALSRGPVFVITGLKIVKGLRYSNKRTVDRGGSLAARGHITEEASFGGSFEAERGGEDLESYTIKGDIILAYRLQIIKREGFRWIGERELQVESFDHGKAGFMNHNEEAGKDRLDVTEVTAVDAQHFAKEEEYGDVEETGLKDEKERWTLLSISD